MKPTIVLAIVIVVLTACGGANPATPRDVHLNEPFELRRGEAVVVEGENLRLSMDGVSSDSRCPVDVVCVWEGDAVVQISLSKPPAKDVTVDLHTSRRFSAEGDFEGYCVKLLGLHPVPRSALSIPADAYRVTMKVERSGEHPADRER